MKSLVSVIIPTYNYAHFVIDAINSVLNQTYKSVEIIVVDDGSTDNTHKVLEKFILDRKIKYIKKNNGELSSARNAGIKVSTADYIAFLDADDMWEPNKLEEQIKIFKNSEYKNLGVVYCQYSLIDTSGRPLVHGYTVKINPTMKGMIFERLLESNTIVSSGSGVLIKRECLEKTGYFDEDLKSAEDWDMWLRLAKHFEFDYSDKNLVKIRKHSKNMQNNNIFMFKSYFYFLNKWANELPTHHPVFDKWADSVAYAILTRFPKIDFMIYAQKKMSLESKRKIFHVSSGSLLLYLFLFLLIRLIIYPKKLFNFIYP
jgi:glycosyltransferase involved in cell wall biosynthesis